MTIRSNLIKFGTELGDHKKIDAKIMSASCGPGRQGPAQQVGTVLIDAASAAMKLAGELNS